MRRTILSALLVVVVIFLGGGCSAMPPKQSLGLERDLKDGGSERLVSAFLIIGLPARESSFGYEVTLPDELRKSALVGVEKEFKSFTGESIRLKRKAFQGVLPDGRHVSVYISPEGKAFVLDSREVGKITLFDPEGKPYDIREFRRLSTLEVADVFSYIEKDFPNTTQPIDGTEVRFLFGQEADLALMVPPTTTLLERASSEGLLAVRLTPNVWGELISRVFSTYRTLSTSPVENALSDTGKADTHSGGDDQLSKSLDSLGDK